MTVNVGREATLQIDGQNAAYIRTKSLSWGGESIDVTNGASDGIRVLLGASGQEQIDISIEGLAENDFLLTKALDTASDKLMPCTLTFDVRNPSNTNPATLSGTFRMPTYEEGSPYNEATTFSASLESSGAWTYTPES